MKSDRVFVKIVNFLRNYIDVISIRNNVYANDAIVFEFKCSLLTSIYRELQSFKVCKLVL